MTEEIVKKESLWKEIKRLWLIFLLFSIISVIISAGVSTYVSTKVLESMQGPPCEIKFSQEVFELNISTPFNLPYLFVNLRDKDLLIENTENYCYWTPLVNESQQENKTTQIPTQTSQGISMPKEFEKFPASQSSGRMTTGCLSPEKEGIYKIKIITKTTSGTCEGYIIMDVKK